MFDSAVFIEPVDDIEELRVTGSMPRGSGSRASLRTMVISVCVDLGGWHECGSTGSMYVSQRGRVLPEAGRGEIRGTAAADNAAESCPTSPCVSLLGG